MPNEIATVNPNNQLSNIPAHLQKAPGAKAAGMELIRQFIVPPRLKFVQPQSNAELKREFHEGDLIVVPQRRLVAEMLYDNNRPTGQGGVIEFVPLFFYPEWLVFNPITMPNLPTIRDRSREPKSDIARKAKNPNARREVCPENDKEEIRYIESLNFLVHIRNVDFLWGTVVCMAFQSGEHKVGMKFAGDIGLRRTDIYGCIFHATAGHRIKDKYNWYGYNVTNPPVGVESTSQWVEATDEYEWYASLYDGLKENYEAGLIEVDFDDANDAIDTTATAVDANDPNAKF